MHIHRFWPYYTFYDTKLNQGVYQNSVKKWLYVLLSDCGSSNDYAGPWGVITSPGYPDYYGNNLDCSFLITLADQIRLTFTDIYIEGNGACGYDYLKVNLDY